MPELSKQLRSSILQWLKTHEHDSRYRFKIGYQARILLDVEGKQRFVIKVASGKGLAGWIQRLTLRHEMQVYQQLSGLEFVPQCYGLFERNYLILEYIDAESLRDAKPVDHEAFCRKLFAVITQLHQRGIAHRDLKRKDNILLKDGQEPVLIDFGAAVIEKPGFNLFSHYWFALGKRFDLNAWIKYKYHRRYENITEEDWQYWHRTKLERIAKRVKKVLRRVKKKKREKV